MRIDPESCEPRYGCIEDREDFLVACIIIETDNPAVRNYSRLVFEKFGGRSALRKSGLFNIQSLGKGSDAAEAIGVLISRRTPFVVCVPCIIALDPMRRIADQLSRCLEDFDCLGHNVFSLVRWGRGKEGVTGMQQC